MSGKIVKEIMNEDMFYGKSSRTVNVGSLAAGTYVYTIETKNFRDSRKLVVR
jgi:hypothetical protein